MKINTIILCDHALIDKKGKVSLIGIFDKANFTHKINALIRFFLCVFLDPENTDKDENLQFSILLKDPTGQSILPKPLIVDVRSSINGEKGRLIIELNNIKFDNTGIYSFEVYVNSKLLKTTSLNISNS